MLYPPELRARASTFYRAVRAIRYHRFSNLQKRHAAAFILAVALALVGAGQAFRSDEVWSLHAVAKPWPAMLAELRADIHPPFYYILLKLWAAAFGTSEYAVRSLSVLLHCAAGFIVYRTAGPLAGAVLLVSPLGLLSAQFVRMYALLEFVGAVLLWAYAKQRVVLFAIAAAAGTFAHVWFFFLLGAQGLIALYERRFKLAIAGAAGALPYLALWLPTMVQQARRTNDALAWLKPPTWYAPFEAALLQGGIWWLLVPVLLPALWRGKREWLVWVLAIAVPFFLSFVKPVFWTRFTVVALPAFAVAAARSADRRHAAALVFCLGAALHIELTFARTTDCDSRWTAQWLAAHARPGDAVIFTNLSRLATEYYWKPAPGITVRSFPAQIDAHPGYEGTVQPAEAEDEARTLMQNLRGKRVYILHGFMPASHEPLLRLLKPKLLHECSASSNYYRRISLAEVP